MTSLNSRMQLALLNRKKGRNLLEKGFTLVELMIVIVIVGILSSVALPNFLSQSAKAKITEPLGKVSAGIKQAQSLWVELGSFSNVSCTDIGFTETVVDPAADTPVFEVVENGWTYTCDPADGGKKMTLTAIGVIGGPNENLELTNCTITGATGVIDKCDKKLS